MKKKFYTAFTVILLLVATLNEANAQKVTYHPSKVNIGINAVVNKIAASSKPNEVFTFSPAGNFKTLVIKSNRVTSSSDTVGILSMSVVTTALVNTSHLQVLYVFGRGDTAVAGIKIQTDEFIYPSILPDAQSSITHAAAMGDSVLFGGEFSVTNNGGQTFTNLAILDALQMDYHSPGSSYPNGVSSVISAMRISPDKQSIVLGYIPTSEMNVQYVVATQDFGIVDTIVTNFAPSSFGGGWILEDIAFALQDAHQALFLSVSAYDVADSAYVVFLPDGDVVTDTVGVFGSSVVQQMEFCRKQLWGVVSSTQSSMMTKKLMSLIDPDNSASNIPRFADVIGNGAIGNILPLDSELLVGGFFNYRLTNGDTAVNTMAILITDTIAPQLFASVVTDTIQVLRGSEVFWYNDTAYQFVTAYDNFDGTLPVTLSGFVDSSTVGNYLLSYAATDAAGNSTSIEVVFVVYDTATAISEVPLQVTVYPNPTKDWVMVNTEESGSYQIVSSIGRQVTQGYFSSGTTLINFSELPKGIYFLRLQSDKKMAVEKILRE